ncbi:MAG: DUF1573 domain-containing protein [Verrucomicrobia bacterium]|nr:DUF1573 domain-containing protein [Verrucomicrobiota bacterium]
MTQYRMRKWTLWLLFCMACADLAAGPRWDRQRIEHTADIQEHEFTAVFRFTNTAEQAIEITRIQSGCGCTVAEPDRWHYEPGRKR